MDSQQAIQLEKVRQRVQATDADMSGSTFNNVNLGRAAFNDVNLAEATVQNANLFKLRISNANLSCVSIADSNTEGMTIDAIPVADLNGRLQGRSIEEELAVRF